jgi:hypothetical protein
VGKQAKNSESAVRGGVGRTAFGHVWVCCLGQFASAAVGHGCGSRHLGLAGPGDVRRLWCVGSVGGWAALILFCSRCGLTSAISISISPWCRDCLARLLRQQLQVTGMAYRACLAVELSQHVLTMRGTRCCTRPSGRATRVWCRCVVRDHMFPFFFHLPRRNTLMHSGAGGLRLACPELFCLIS